MLANTEGTLFVIGGVVRVPGTTLADPENTASAVATAIEADVELPGAALPLNTAASVVIEKSAVGPLAPGAMATASE